MYPPNDAGVLFIETSGCLPMCGHGTIGTVTVAIEQNLIRPKTPGVLNLEVPAGLVRAEYVLDGSRVSSVKITNIKSYLAAEKLTVDVAYGGNFYVIVDPQPNFPGLEHYKAEQLIAWARAMNEKYTFTHPENDTIRGLSHRPRYDGPEPRTGYGQTCFRCNCR